MKIKKSHQPSGVVVVVVVLVMVGELGLTPSFFVVVVPS